MHAAPLLSSSFVYFFSDIVDSRGGIIGEAHSHNDGQITLGLATMPLDGRITLQNSHVAPNTVYDVVLCPQLSHPECTYALGSALSDESSISIQLHSNPMLSGQITLRIR